MGARTAAKSATSAAARCDHSRNCRRGCLPDGRGERRAGDGRRRSTDSIASSRRRRPKSLLVDERLNRADIRLDPTSKAVSEGLPLRLKINVMRVDGSACAPVQGALVDVWQCDALGVYSDVRDSGGLFDTRGRKFLRGYQETDRLGATEFLTVYPGWYPGRTVHIHFKVRVASGSQRSHEFTSQLYFDDAITDQVHAQPPYRANGKRDVRNDLDGIYRARGSGSKLLLRLSKSAEGYLGETAVGLQMA